MEVQRGISFDRNLALVGTRTQALIDRLDPEDPEYAAVGRTAAQALDVDGVTNLVVPRGIDDGILEPGRFVDVEIVDALDYDLVAEVRT